MNKYSIIIAMLLAMGSAFNINANPNRNTPTRDGGSQAPSPFLIEITDEAQEATEAVANPLTLALEGLQIAQQTIVENEQEDDESTANVSPVTNISPIANALSNNNSRAISPILMRVRETNRVNETEGHVIFPQNQGLTAGGIPLSYTQSLAQQAVQAQGNPTNSPARSADSSGDSLFVIAPIEDDFDLNDNQNDNEDE